MWLTGLGCVGVYMAFTHLTTVPSYTTPSGDSVTCGIRGGLTPNCTAAGYFDRLILQPQHMYSTPTFARLPECLVLDTALRPGWCR